MHGLWHSQHLVLTLLGTTYNLLLLENVSQVSSYPSYPSGTPLLTSQKLAVYPISLMPLP